MRAVAGLSRMEILFGLPIGPARAPLSMADVPPDERGLAPRAALERSLTRLLAAGPVATSFSGGRDSSALLALLVHLARREGLPMPRPLVLDVVGSKGADERHWQDVVLRHLRLDPAERLPITEELDIVGPEARALLGRHGLVWPFNTHMHAPMVRLTPGATMVTGFGGDEIFDSGQHFRLAQVFAGRRRARARDALHLATTLVRPLEMLNDARHSPAPPWATRWGDLRHRWLRGRSGARERQGWAAALRQWWGGRYRMLTEDSLALLGADHGCAVQHPFTSPGFVWAIGRAGGRAGPGTRSQVMRGLVGDLLPPEVVTRHGKAVFDDALWTGHARHMAVRVDPTQLCRGVADPEELRREWLSEKPHILSATALQALTLQQGLAS